VGADGPAAVSSADMDGRDVGRIPGRLDGEVLNSGSSLSGRATGVDWRRARSRLKSGTNSVVWAPPPPLLLARRRSRGRAGPDGLVSAAAVVSGRVTAVSSSSAIRSSWATWRRRVDRRRLRRAAASWALARRLAPPEWWWNNPPPPGTGLGHGKPPPGTGTALKDPWRRNRSRAPRSLTGIVRSRRRDNSDTQRTRFSLQAHTTIMGVFTRSSKHPGNFQPTYTKYTC